MLQLLLVLTCQISALPLQLGSMQYTIMDDNVEAAPIYRCDDRAKQPTRPHEIHGLCMEWEPTWTESTEATDTVIRSSCMPIIGYHIQNPGNMIMYILSVVRLRIGPAVAPLCID